MGIQTALSTFNLRLDSLLQGIPVADISDADRDNCVREAVAEYGMDLPRRQVVEFAGDGSRYYSLFGKVVNVDEGDRSTGIDLTSTGADSRLAVTFDLDRESEIHELGFYMRRTGAVVSGTLQATLWTDDASASHLPETSILTLDVIDPDGDEGAPVGRYAKVRFRTEPFQLPAGKYHAAITAPGYTYANGTNELILGVDQSAPAAANPVRTWSGTAWSVYSPASDGVLEVLAGIPGWRSEIGQLLDVEYPAADVDAGESPQMLEPDDYQVFLSAAGAWLRFAGLEPATSEVVRLVFGRPYTWRELTDPSTETPPEHFEAICNLAAARSCERLAVRYAQKSMPTISADTADRRTQSDHYKTLSDRYFKVYRRLTGLDKSDQPTPGAAVLDMDLGPLQTTDFLFHGRRIR